MAFWHDPAYAAFWLNVARGELATWLQLTPYAYAAVEGVHLVGVAFFFGPIFLLDLRLLGLMPRLAAAPAARFLLSISAPAFVLVTVSGVLLFVPSADRHAASAIFFIKIGAIAAGGLNALAFHATAWRRVDVWGRLPPTPWSARTAAVVSLVVWISVLALGRAMGYERRQAPDVDVETLRVLDGVRPSADR
jgi:uncharacterized protein DUF6644